MSEIGHNIAWDRLRSHICRIERLEEERKSLAADIKDIYTEAASAGFDKKVMRRLVADRRREESDVMEEQTLLEIYRRALDNAYEVVEEGGADGD